MASENEALMRDFKRAFGRADPDLLRSVVTPDFAWHMHWYRTADPLPTGNVVTGVDAVMTEIAWRAANWRDVRFDDMTERYVDDVVLQTFRTSGTDHSGAHFETDVVDLYRIVDRRLASKDTYWKQPARNGEDLSRSPDRSPDAD